MIREAGWRREALRQALSQRADGDDNHQPGWWLRTGLFTDRFGLSWRERFVLPRAWRVCMALKFAVCLLLGREGYAYGDVDVDWVMVAVFNSGSYATQDGTTYYWEYAAVSPGWHRWRYDVGSDGT